MCPDDAEMLINRTMPLSSPTAMRRGLSIENLTVVGLVDVEIMSSG